MAYTELEKKIGKLAKETYDEIVTLLKNNEDARSNEGLELVESAYHIDDDWILGAECQEMIRVYIYDDDTFQIDVKSDRCDDAYVTSEQLKKRPTELFDLYNAILNSI